MPPSGIIYQSASFLKRMFYGLMRGVGAGIISFVVLSVIFAYYPLVKEEISYKFSKKAVATQSGFGSLLDRVYADSASRTQEEAKKLGVDSYFSIVIPKIDAHSRIIANVDSGNKEEYLDALSHGVAHARGTYFPGQGKGIFLYAHSTDSPLNFARYNAVFYLLGKLEEGDKIIVFFADKKYEYKVFDKVTTSATDTSWLTDKGMGEVLILQTCYPPGTTWQRLLVLAKPVTQRN